MKDNQLLIIISSFLIIIIKPENIKQANYEIQTGIKNVDILNWSFYSFKNIIITKCLPKKIVFANFNKEKIILEQNSVKDLLTCSIINEFVIFISSKGELLLVYDFKRMISSNSRIFKTEENFSDLLKVKSIFYGNFIVNSFLFRNNKNYNEGFLIYCLFISENLNYVKNAQFLNIFIKEKYNIFIDFHSFFDKKYGFYNILCIYENFIEIFHSGINSLSFFNNSNKIVINEVNFGIDCISSSDFINNGFLLLICDKTKQISLLKFSNNSFVKICQEKFEFFGNKIFGHFLKKDEKISFVIIDSYNQTLYFRQIFFNEKENFIEKCSNFNQIFIYKEKLIENFGEEIYFISNFNKDINIIIIENNQQKIIFLYFCFQNNKFNEKTKKCLELKPDYFSSGFQVKNSTKCLNNKEIIQQKNLFLKPNELSQCLFSPLKFSQLTNLIPMISCNKLMNINNFTMKSKGIWLNNNDKKINNKGISNNFPCNFTCLNKENQLADRKCVNLKEFNFYNNFCLVNNDCYNCSNSPNCIWNINKGICQYYQSRYQIDLFKKFYFCQRSETRCHLIKLNQLKGEIKILPEKVQGLIERNFECEWEITNPKLTIFYKINLLMEFNNKKDFKEEIKFIEVSICFFTNIENNYCIRRNWNGERDHVINSINYKKIKINVIFLKGINMNSDDFKIKYEIKLNFEFKNITSTIFLLSIFFFLLYVIVKFFLGIYYNGPRNNFNQNIIRFNFFKENYQQRMKRLLKEEIIFKSNFSIDNNDPYEQIACTFCLEDYINNVEIVKFNCKHVFHFKCFQQWNKVNYSARILNCPVCLKELQKENLYEDNSEMRSLELSSINN